MRKYIVGINNDMIKERSNLAARLPFITEAIALAIVPFEELLSFQFGSILRIVNLFTIALAFVIGRITILKIKPPTIYLLLFVLIAAVSYFWCFNTGLYDDRMFTYGLYLVLILALGSLTPTSSEKEMMLKGLFIGGIVASMLLLATNASSLLGNRATLVMLGRTVNPNRLSLSFVLSANYSTYELFYCNGKKTANKIFWIFADILLAVGIIASGSRSSFIVLLICVLFLAWKRDFGNNAKLKRILFVAFVILVMYAIYSEVILGSEFGDRFTFDNLIGMGEYGTANREKIWSAAIAQIEERPIFGYGNGASPYVIALQYKYYGTHNSYLMILLEFGVVGFIICSAMFVSTYRRYKRQNNQLFCSFIICILVDIIFVEGFSAKVFWAVMVLLMVCLENVSGTNND